MLNESLSDQELWEAILKEDSQAFAMFYNRFWLRLYKTAFHYIKDSTVCEEVVHDVFIIIWNKRKSLKIEHFVSYLNATTRYEVFRYIKATKLSILEYNESYVEKSSDAVFNLGQVRLNEHDIEHQLNAYLKGLPKRCREIFYLSKIQQLTNEEIAKQLGISKHTVENQLTYALKHLKVSAKGLSILSLFVYFF
ncbi:MAG: polymerase sigma factor, sigma-70 family [Segetibacter sp.]|nr:polymerase sigma factor, sigma-70 family [Segetibacter sp.]